MSEKCPGTPIGMRGRPQNPHSVGSSPTRGTKGNRRPLRTAVLSLPDVTLSRMYDRQIVDQALTLVRQGFSDRKVAEMCGVSVGAVHHWRYGDRRAYPLVDPTKTCPRCSDRPFDRRVYAYLLGLYLG